jgi:hypothetical protein
MKWRPFWRYGTVTGKDEDNDTLDVSLQPILSKGRARGWRSKRILMIMSGSRLSAVPVVYMSCGAAVFEIGDEVVVEFRVSGGNPTPFVIGFKDNPRECNIWPEFIYLKLAIQEIVSSTVTECIIPAGDGSGTIVDDPTYTYDLQGRVITESFYVYWATYDYGTTGSTTLLMGFIATRMRQ